ncbi:MAG: OmpA family protein [Pseudomonadota bacterium]
MSCRTVQKFFSLFTVNLTVTATSAFALPADVGRTADVFTNAVRFQNASAPAIDGPKARPQDFVVAVAAQPQEPFDASVFSKVDEAFEVALEPVDLGPRWISKYTDDELYAVALEPNKEALLNVPVKHLEDLAFGHDVERIDLASANIPIAPKEDEAFGTPVARTDFFALNIPGRFVEDSLHDVSLAPVPVATLNIPTHFKEDELFKVALEAVDTRTLAVARFTEDDAFDVPLQPVALASFDVPPAVFEQQTEAVEAEVLQAAADAVEDAIGANSSSRADVDDEDLMSQMADADDNLVIRDGGEGGVDTMMMSSDVLFSFGSATLADDALTTLQSIGQMSGDVPMIEVFGHTDAIGSESNNLRLGQERAEAVREWLLENTDFTAEQVIATGIGEVDPVAPNVTEAGDDNPDGRAQNRRVEFAFHEAGYVPE